MLIFAIVIILAKDIEILVYENIFLLAKIYIFRKINKIFNKYRKIKKNFCPLRGYIYYKEYIRYYNPKNTEMQV
jgi:hypothetical protein